MTDLKCSLLVLGAGPGGYVCAIRAGQLGVNTIIVDPKPVGGTCLNVGCIPSKALIHAGDEMHAIRHAPSSPLGISVAQPDLDLSQTVEWKDGIVARLTGGVAGLLRKAKVRHIVGQGTFIDGRTVRVKTNDGVQTIRAEKIVIATGSTPVEVPSLPFGGDIVSSTGALEFNEVPEKLAVVGGGYIGLELGTAYAKLGAQVTIVEAGERILPQYDAALTAPVAKRLNELGIEVKLNCKASSYASGELETESGPIGADKVLVTVGRKPQTEGLGLDQLVVEMNGQFIKVDTSCETTMSGIYAIGDVCGEPMLAHRAMAQGEMVAKIVAGETQIWDKRCIPAICFTDPEVVVCGALPDEEDGSKSALFPFKANGRSMTLERDDGFVRVVWREADHAVIGIQAVGAGVAELAASFTLAIEMGARLEDIAQTIHAHPTLSEGLQEAAFNALGSGLHI